MVAYAGDICTSLHLSVANLKEDERRVPQQNTALSSEIEGERGKTEKKRTKMKL